ncbi:MAG: hypothetical protein ACU0BN_13965 [Sulfitobacter sp.]|uniref:hypothetical protein n=1 Tax=Sulfitobacter sp. TaxID=1903071 RepID=UPI00405A1F80
MADPLAKFSNRLSTDEFFVGFRQNGSFSTLSAQSGWAAGVTSYQLMDDGRKFLRDQQSHAPGTEAFYDVRITFADTALGPLILRLLYLRFVMLFPSATLAEVSI